MILNSVKTRRALSLLVFYILCLAVLVIVAYPVLWMLLGSLKESWEVTTYPFSLPLQPTLENYREAWHSVNMGRLLFNSTFISVTVALGKIVLSMTAAFAFTYFGDFRGKYFFFVVILITHMLPLPIRIVPTFELMMVTLASCWVRSARNPARARSGGWGV